MVGYHAIFGTFLLKASWGCTVYSKHRKFVLSLASAKAWGIQPVKISPSHNWSSCQIFSFLPEQCDHSWEICGSVDIRMDIWTFGQELQNYVYTLWSIKTCQCTFCNNLQMLTDFDTFCTKLTSNELRTLGYQNVSLHHACVSTLPCKIRKQRFFHVDTESSHKVIKILT